MLTAQGLEALTKCEREVLTLVAHGFNNDETAEYMVVSPTTAKTHVSRILTKLQARDRAQLVVFAYQSGLVSRSIRYSPRVAFEATMGTTTLVALMWPFPSTAQCCFDQGRAQAPAHPVGFADEVVQRHCRRRQSQSYCRGKFLQ